MGERFAFLLDGIPSPNEWLAAVSCGRLACLSRAASSGDRCAWRCRRRSRDDQSGARRTSAIPALRRRRLLASYGALLAPFAPKMLTSSGVVGIE